VSFIRRLFGEDDREGEDDGKLIGRLEAAGVDLSQPLEVEHFLTLPDERTARQVVAKLASTGGAVQLSPTVLGRRWTVRVTIPMVVTPERMAALRAQLDGFAGEHGGTYEGWGTNARRG
jgi:hypothetical protein